MELKVTKDKYGKLSSAPIFQDGKVIFPAFINAKLAREGEVWEAYLIELVPLNKKVMDKTEILDSFELKNYYELRTAVAPDGKAVEYILIKIKLS